MDVRFVDASGAHSRQSDDVVVLLEREDGFVWVDVPVWDDEVDGFLWVDVPAWDSDAEAFLERLGCHPLVVDACRQRNHVPTVHSYPDHYFVTVHAPLLGRAGHVHLLELDQIVGTNFLVTVHGPLNPVVDPNEALLETRAVLQRIEAGRFSPTTPAELSYAVTSAVVRRQRGLVGDVA